MYRLLYSFLVLLTLSDFEFCSGSAHTYPVSHNTQYLIEQHKKKIVFITSANNHDVGEHEYKGGCYLLAKLLNENVPDVSAIVYDAGWPKDSTALYDAASIVFYCNGGERHLLLSHLEEMDKLIRRGTGIVMLHNAVEAPKEGAGNYFLDWTGGYFETYYSVNPRWAADFEKFPEHEITNGVNPFNITDEWYYNLRFKEGMKNIIPLLKAIPQQSSLCRQDGPYSGNAFARKAVAEKKPQVLAWAYNRPDGGRAFDFTGAHFHNHWKNDNFRKFVLNAIVWTAKIKVPQKGIFSQTPTQAELNGLLDKQ